jgi:hypothetical protein
MLVQQLLGPIGPVTLLFLHIPEELSQVAQALGLCILNVLVVRLGTLERVIQDTHKVIGGVTGASLSLMMSHTSCLLYQNGREGSNAHARLEAQRSHDGHR